MYEILASFAQTWGMLLFVTLFLGALTYALWPKNQERFDKAANAPLNESDSPADAAASED
ncbi:MAG: cbb3-type cytochrome c oxidase subunit 3 [Alphaproteobacteria bacterium]|nr:cbb3-type cytochrome c oxidase subunit 3 [Alphaproteobacteria bacterium]